MKKTFDGHKMEGDTFIRVRMHGYFKVYTFVSNWKGHHFGLKAAGTILQYLIGLTIPLIDSSDWGIAWRISPSFNSNNCSTILSLTLWPLRVKSHQAWGQINCQIAHLERLPLVHLCSRMMNFYCLPRWWSQSPTSVDDNLSLMLKKGSLNSQPIWMYRRDLHQLEGKTRGLLVVCHKVQDKMFKPMVTTVSVLVKCHFLFLRSLQLPSFLLSIISLWFGSSGFYHKSGACNPVTSWDSPGCTVS